MPFDLFRARLLSSHPSIEDRHGHRAGVGRQDESSVTSSTLKQKLEPAKRFQWLQTYLQMRVSQSVSRAVRSTPTEVVVPFRFGGHLDLDFVNTVDSWIRPVTRDYLATFPERIGWSRQWSDQDCSVQPRVRFFAVGSRADRQPACKFGQVAEVGLRRTAIYQRLSEGRFPRWWWLCPKCRSGSRQRSMTGSPPLRKNSFAPGQMGTRISRRLAWRIVMLECTSV
jgi:hypothetical protein